MAKMPSNAFLNLVRFSNSLGEMICFLIILFMIFSTIADTSMRYFFSNPLPGVIEYNGMLVAVIAFIGLANTQAMKGHIEVTSVTMRLSPEKQIKFKIGALILSMAFIGVMIYTTLMEALHSYSIKEYDWGVIGQTIYIWWAKFALPVGLSMLFLQYIVDLSGNFGKLRGTASSAGAGQNDGLRDG